MDDGHLKIKNNVPIKIILSTESFTAEENNWLINFLMDKYQLSFRTDKQHRIILYDRFQIFYFLYIVTPYLHHSMCRKIPSRCNLVHDIKSRRTTISLPETITLKSPTKDINTILHHLHELISQYKHELFYKKWVPTIVIHESLTLKPYQISLSNTRIKNLKYLQELTGLTFNQLAYLSYMVMNENSHKSTHLS